MIFNQRLLRHVLISGLVLMSVPVMVSASPMEPQDGTPACHGFRHGTPESGHGNPPPPLFLPSMKLLEGMTLSEEQQDKVFEIVHDAAPAMRETAKAVQRAESELRKAELADTYDAGKVRQLSEACGKAMAEMLLVRSRTDHRIYALLTADQRREVETRIKKFEEHAGEFKPLPD